MSTTPTPLPSETMSREERREQLRKAGCWCDKHDVERDVETDCHVCHGEGLTEDADNIIGRGVETCWSCHGSGIGWPDCEYCLDEEDYL